MKIKGVRKIAGQSKSLKGSYDPFYLQLNYDTEENVAWADELYSLGHNSWKQYHGQEVVNCGFITNPVTMKEVITMIQNVLFGIEEGW